jgi:hypothetical protein
MAPSRPAYEDVQTAQTQTTSSRPRQPHRSIRSHTSLIHRHIHTSNQSHPVHCHARDNHATEPASSLFWGPDAGANMLWIIGTSVSPLRSLARKNGEQPHILTFALPSALPVCSISLYPHKKASGMLFSSQSFALCKDCDRSCQYC